MYVVIVGAGDLGVAVATQSISAGHEVTVIDSDPYRCDLIDELLGAVSISGDGTEMDILSRAGVNRAGVIIATTDRDDVNLVACQLAKNRFGVARAISVVNAPELCELFDSLGVDVVVDVVDVALNRIQEGLLSQRVVRLLQISETDRTVLVSVLVPPDIGTEGRMLSDIRLPEGSLVSLLVNRDGTAFVPDSASTIRPGDQMIVLTKEQDEEGLINILLNGSSEQE